MTSSVAALRIIRPADVPGSGQPLTAGIPLPRGWLYDVARVELRDDHSQRVPVQCQPLAHWSDQSIKWLLVDFLLPAARPESARSEAIWTLARTEPAADSSASPATPVRIVEAPEAYVVEVDAARFRVDRGALEPVLRVCPIAATTGADDRQPSGQTVSVRLVDRHRRALVGQIETSAIEAHGPLRATIALAGRFDRGNALRFVCRLCFFAGGFVRVRLTIHNPRRALHPGGLWDLGDSGSVMFRSLELAVRPDAGEASMSADRDAIGPTTNVEQVSWRSEIDQPLQSAGGAEMLAIEQASSGGENWNSLNHVDRHGRVPLQYRGYVVRRPAGKIRGDRATPLLSRTGAALDYAVAVPEFWQQFPKRLTNHAEGVDVELFPQFEGLLHELQGGEQKTHTVWLNFIAGEPAKQPEQLLESLAWVHRPATAIAAGDWSIATGAIAHLPQFSLLEAPLAEVLTTAAHGPRSLAARRELIDEYGWRNYGDWYADHEAQHYAGPGLPISHYNNQFDGLWGTLSMWLAGGEPAWFELADSLARHLIDIDLYRTQLDRPAYNGGLFWFTDHYRTAATATHRTYSRHNLGNNGANYGGGPGPEHNFASGLLLYWYLTGDPQARDAVVSFADWTIAMDDGRRTALGWLDSGPTGLASMTASVDYHGPGRGAGNSLNTLLDGWLATGRREYLEYGERIMRRVVHPADDIDSHNLLNAEKRWSYTVFLAALARYLDLKAEAGELDRNYAYGQASLAHYANWMLAHERPYFDRRDELQYPTEAWPMQELRKANVLRLAAAHVDESTRGRMLQRGRELADRAWDDWAQFATRDSTRAISILLTEGVRDAWFRRHEPAPAPRAPGDYDFGKPEPFQTQRQRVWQLCRSPGRLVRRGFSRLVGKRPQSPD
ncbi:MAG: hypothetical protein AB7U73_16635 [Pirellulales bacterium]